MTPHGDHLFWPQPQWRSLQSQRLAAHLQHAATSPLYRHLHLSPETPLHELPLNSKDELSAAGKNAWAAPPDQVREWVCTSGTTGKPLDVPLTAADLDRLAENEAVALSAAGIRQGDLVLLAVAMDRLFVAGLAYHRGAQKIGAASARVGPHIANHPDLLQQLLSRLAAPNQRTFLIAVPSFLTSITSLQTPLTAVIAIGEPTRNADLLPNALARQLTRQLNCPVLSTYALTETCATFAESPACQGGHLNPALATLEILDPTTHTPLPDNTPGEVTITPLGVQGLPLLRFQTGDIAALHTSPCPCGRTTPRLGPILGRRQHLLKFKGTSLYPSAILEALRTLPFFHDACLIATADHPLSDKITLHVHIAPDNQATRHHLESTLKSLLRATPELIYTTPDALTKLQTSTTRKPQRFLDHRPPS